jgi:hypothetical protein
MDKRLCESTDGVADSAHHSVDSHGDRLLPKGGDYDDLVDLDEILDFETESN